MKLVASYTTTVQVSPEDWERVTHHKEAVDDTTMEDIFKWVAETERTTVEQAMKAYTVKISILK